MHLSNDRLPFWRCRKFWNRALSWEIWIYSIFSPKSNPQKSNYLEPELKYPPYSDAKLNILKKLL